MNGDKTKAVVDAFLQLCIDNGLTYTEVGDVVCSLRSIVAEQRTALVNTTTFSVRDTGAASQYQCECADTR